MDATSIYLKEIDRLMDQYVEIPTYQAVFEAGGEADAAMAKNSKIESDSKNLFQKACSAIRTIFDRIKEIIGTIFKWLSLSKDEKTKYRAFVEKCKDDPAFAGKTITFADYTKCNAYYEENLKRYEKEYRNLKDEEMENRPTIAKVLEEKIDSVKEHAKKLAKAGVKTATVKVALEHAKQCKENAAIVQMMIDYDMGLLDEIEKEIGKVRMGIFKMKVRALQSRFKIIRKLAGCREDQSKGLRDTIKDILTNANSIWDVAVSSKTIRKEAGITVKDQAEVGFKAAKGAWKEHRADKQMAAQMKAKDARNEKMNTEKYNKALAKEHKKSQKVWEKVEKEKQRKS